MRWVAALALLLLSCSSDPPTKVGHLVEEGGACHEVLKAQCTCCDAGEINCAAHVEALVGSGQAWANSTDAECKPDAEAAAADPLAFCERFDSEAKLRFACQQYYEPADPGDVRSDAP